MIHTKHTLSVDVAGELIGSHAVVHIADSHHEPLVRLEGELHFVALQLLAFAECLDHQGTAHQVGGVTQFRAARAEPISINTHNLMQHYEDKMEFH